MKRRMNAAERVACEAVARPILAMYVRRVIEAGHARQSAQSMTRLVIEVLRRGCMVSSSPADGLRLSLVQQWVVAVEWALQQLDEISPAARYILLLRLSRTPKKEESSFGRIAWEVTAEFEKAGRPEVFVDEGGAQALYRAALLRFHALVNERGIGRDLGASETWQGVHVPVCMERREARQLIAMGRALMAFATRVERRRRHRLPGQQRSAVKVLTAQEAAAVYREPPDGTAAVRAG